MTTILGDYTFPNDPRIFKLQQPREIREVRVRERSPDLLDFGPLVRMLKLEGYLVKTGEDAQTAWTNNVLPLKNMSRRGMAVPKVWSDDDAVSKAIWTAIATGSGGLGIPTLSDSTVQVAKGVNSMQVVVGAGAQLLSGFYDTLGPVYAEDWSKHDFYWYWVYGLNDSGTIYFRLYAPDASNWFYYNLTDDFSGWRRVIVRKDMFSIGGGSPDWTDIEDIRFLWDTLGTRYFDRNGPGVGFYLDAPGTRYDGIYCIRKLIVYEERVARFPFELELELSDDDY